MKKVVTLGITIIMVCLLLIGCSNNSKKDEKTHDKNTQSSYNPFDLKDEQVNVDAEFSFGPVNPVDELTYTGEPIEVEYAYDNLGDTDFKAGFMIFIDGIAQVYKVDGENKEEIMHEFNVKKKSQIKFKASFKPNIGEKGDKLSLHITSTLNPNYVASSNYPSFGNNLGLSQALPVNLRYLKSVNYPELKIHDKYSIENITKEIKKEYLGRGKDNTEEYVLNEEALLKLKYKGDDRESKIELKKNSKLSLTLEGFGGPKDTKYRTTIFIDNKPVKTIDGKEYLEMEVKKNMLSKQNFDVDISELKGTHVLYTISVPRGRGTYSIVKSSPKLLIVEE